MNWFDSDTSVVIDPLADSERQLARIGGASSVPIAQRVVFASRYHGVFDSVVELLPEYGTVSSDKRDKGYVSLRTSSASEITVFSAPGPAPWAAQTLEVLIARGARSVIFVNGCGSLDPARGVGSLLIPDSLIREEGTSYHYVPAHRELETSRPLRRRIEDASAAMGYSAHAGAHWTTDAIYRETFSKVRAYSLRGIASVEMELSALVAVAEYRNVELAAILVVTDLAGEHHTWSGVTSADFVAGRTKAARVAMEAITSC